MVSTTLLALIYLSFISLGLPDSVLGSAWPAMSIALRAPLWGAGLVQMLISFCTIISSLNSAKLIRKFGTGKLTAISVAATALALLGFSFAPNYVFLLLMAIPLGLGAGAVDAGLNNYVALHCEAKHMSWLHCFWGVGTIIGPIILSALLKSGRTWASGYRAVGLIQCGVSLLLFMTLNLWKRSDIQQEEHEARTLSVAEVLRLPGAKAGMTTFFCYCALEQTTGLWASSYLSLHKGIPAETAAAFASLFFIGITVGRAISGFVTMKLNDIQMIRLGQGIIVAGIVAMILPGSNILAMAGLILIGLGCAPIYPCVIHSTPAHFGADKSQAIIGVQMAFAYIGTMLMPPLFGLIARGISVALLPFYLFVILVVMIIMHELLTKKTA